ncbi:MAG: multicopper oxidase domain-containing protein, partial [Polyangiaceae bacterium]|nr:multicopper oxidase domain-containing protein [Polyangiaceae bacterium]
MPQLPVRKGSAFTVRAHNAVHRFHRDLPLSPTFAYGDATYLGAILEAQSGVETQLTFDNDLGEHVFAQDIDTTVHGVTELDRIAPRSVVHLHGGVTPPQFDGHPHATQRPGESFVHRYPNTQEAACLWYHDHAMGITRLNAYA